MTKPKTTPELDEDEQDDLDAELEDEDEEEAGYDDEEPLVDPEQVGR